MNLRTLFLTVACAFNLTQAKAAEPVQIQIVRGGKEVRKAPQSDFLQHVVDLIQSCSVNSTAYAVTNSTWTNLLQSASFVRVVFTPPRKLNVMMAPGLGARERVQTQIEQVLVPLPETQWPEHIYGRVGDHVYSFTKYSPIAFKHVVVEPALALTSLKPYSVVLGFPDK